ncbi:MAG: hypothetical protein ABIP50_03575 [Candidatus Saccharimonadales bacterium]
MILNPETLTRFNNAANGQPLYAPNEATNAIIEPKTIVEFVAPAAEGKSALIREVDLLHSEFSVVTGFTTRPEEARDTGGRYTYFNTDEELNTLLGRIEKGSVVQYVQHPTTGQFYGSFPEDYHTKFNMLDVLSNTVNDLDRLAFKSIFKIAVVSHGEEWINRFLERYPDGSEERTKRVTEAIQSLEWVQNQPKNSLSWLHNRDGYIRGAAHIAISIVKTDRATPDLTHLAAEMYDEAMKVAV